MQRNIRLAAAALALSFAFASPVLADERKNEVVDVVPVELFRTLIGTWCEIKPDGTPYKSMFTPGIKGSERPLDGEMGGDLSVRQSGDRRPPFKPATLTPVAQPDLGGVKLGDMTFYALPPAARRLGAGLCGGREL